MNEVNEKKVTCIMDCHISSLHYKRMESLMYSVLDNLQHSPGILVFCYSNRYLWQEDFDLSRMCLKDTDIVASRVSMWRTLVSHFSTAPCAVLGLNVFTNGTFSPSSLIMAVISMLGWNSIEWMPSKIFFKNGCTRNGSFVSARISRSSSLERK